MPIGWLDRPGLGLARLAAVLAVVALACLGARSAVSQSLDGLTIEELEQMLELLDQQIEDTDTRIDRNNQDIEDIDRMIEDIDETLEHYAPYTNFEPIPLLGVDEPSPLEPGAMPAMTALPAPRDRLGFNAWCFNVLHNLGVRYEFADEHDRDLAGFAMADARTRLYALSDAANLSAEALQSFDQGMFEATLPVAEAIANGSASLEQQSLFDACMAKGVRGVRYKHLYVDPIEGMHTKIWCASTLSIFTQRDMIGGGPERVARAQRALSKLDQWLGKAFEYINIPAADRDVLENGYYFRSVVQVDAFNVTQGDKGRFEADYEVCFPMEDLHIAEFRLDIPTFPPGRPALLSPGWDYPLSFEFRFNIWCVGAMRHIAAGNVPAGSNFTPQAATDIAAEIHARLLIEGQALGLDANNIGVMEAEATGEAELEFTRDWEGDGRLPTSYDHGFCATVGMDVSDLLSTISFGPEAARDEHRRWVTETTSG